MAQDLSRASAPSAGASSKASDDVQFHDGQLSCAGKDWMELPQAIASKYGGKATRLDLSYNELTTLRNVEAFRVLSELILDNNSLGDDVAFPQISTLKLLSLNKNRISDTEKFLVQVKESFPNLSFLSLLGNEACPNELVLKDESDYQRYRYFVLYHLPRLTFLDSRAVKPEEVAEASRVGQFMKVITVSRDEMYSPQEAPSSHESQGQFNPLPQEGRDVATHRGTIGTCKYVYYGRHSEGNRFIRNNDL